MRKIIFTEEELKILKEKVDNGESLINIAKYFKINRDTLKRIIKENNLYDYNNNKQYRKIRAKFDFFENIDSEEKAYWLGFIAADGNVWDSKDGYRSSVKISLNKKDKNHLEKFKKSLNTNAEIRDTITSEGFSNNTELSIISLYSKKMAEDLKKQNVVPNKSLILIPPPNLPENLIKHYIRGYFDGDGTISINKEQHTYNFGMVGTYEMLQWILDKLELDAPIKKDKRTGEKNCYYFKIAGTYKPYEYLSKIYKDSSIYLERKYQIFLQLKQTLSNKETY